MQKTIRRSACLLFILTLAASIVIPTVAEPVSKVIDSTADSGAQSDDVKMPEDYELSTSVKANEPSGNDLVNVIVEVDTPSLLEYANGKGITVQDAMLTSEGVRVVK